MDEDNAELTERAVALQAATNVAFGCKRTTPHRSDSAVYFSGPTSTITTDAAARYNIAGEHVPRPVLEAPLSERLLQYIAKERHGSTLGGL